MTQIRKAVETQGTWFCAKDVFSTLGLSWSGHSSIRDLVITDAKTAKVLTKVGNKTCRLNQIVLSESGIKKVCKKHKKNLSKFTHLFNPPAVTVDQRSGEIARLNKTINDLKLVVAQLLTKSSSDKISLSFDNKNVTVKDDQLQAEARREIRKIVEIYAKKRADELGINDSNKRSIFYDLTYKALYNEYKRRTKRHTDLKEISDQKTTQTGTKISALQVAEQLGLAIELLNLAKKLYGKN